MELCRHLYNAALEQRNLAWRYRRKSVTYTKQQNELPSLKKALPEYNTIHSQVLQDVLRSLDTAFRHFFAKRAGYPKFKSRDNYKSITYPQVDAVVKTFTKLPEGYIYLSGFGFIKINLHRDLDTATVKRINIKKKADCWYANIACEVAEATTVTSTNAVIGIDVGLRTFVATVNGVISNFTATFSLIADHHRGGKCQPNGYQDYYLRS